MCDVDQCMKISVFNSEEERCDRKGILQNTEPKKLKKQKTISDSNATRSGHVRIGWSTLLADLQAPVGYKEHSYGIRAIQIVPWSKFRISANKRSSNRYKHLSIL